jgi:hypothetical protein
VSSTQARAHEFTTTTWIKSVVKSHPISNDPSLVGAPCAGWIYEFSDKSDGASEVVWVAEPSLKPLGCVMSPMLKLGMGSASSKVLDALKAKVEAS